MCVIFLLMICGMVFDLCASSRRHPSVLKVLLRICSGKENNIESIEVHLKNSVVQKHRV